MSDTSPEVVEEVEAVEAPAEPTPREREVAQRQTRMDRLTGGKKGVTVSTPATRSGVPLVGGKVDPLAVLDAVGALNPRAPEDQKAAAAVLFALGVQYLSSEAPDLVAELPRAQTRGAKVDKPEAGTFVYVRGKADPGFVLAVKGRRFLAFPAVTSQDDPEDDSDDWDMERFTDRTNVLGVVTEAPEGYPDVATI